jgi:CRISPR-associated protein Csm1
MEISKRLQAAIAGLLHDVGKLEQRARDDPWNPAPGIEREGQPVHATWTTYFIQNNVPKQYRAAALAGAYHHRPERSPAEDKTLSELVALADKLSAGERADIEKSDQHPPNQMVTIFDRISLGSESKQGGWHYLPLHELSLERDAIFPGQAADNGTVAAYEKLCEPLRDAAQQSIPDGQAYLENLLSAMQRSTWSVPSAYYHSIPDVSLYDHSRMTSALAACLVDMKASRISDMLLAVQRDFEGKPESADRALLDEPICLLVGGDISGIQDFIYTISSKGAARTLRGRSFYLQLLTEAALRYVLDGLELPYTNVIYSGGGHFFLLAPISSAEKLDEIRKEITSILLTHHGTSLYLAVGAAQVPASGFRLGQFTQYWDTMHREVNQTKQKRYTELGEDLYNKIFQPPEMGGNPDDTCSVCGEDTRGVKIWDVEREEQAKICTLCASFAEEIGKNLPQARFVALGFHPPTETQIGGSYDVLNALGMQVQFLDDASTLIDLEEAERVTIWSLDDPIDERWPDPGKLPAARQIRYTVNRTPPGSFDDLQKKVAGGFKRLGVLRMDVDNLGDIFSAGFSNVAVTGGSKRGNLATLARLSTLSFQVSLFFEGWIKQICESGLYEQVVYAVYAGGDDVFVIGPWDRMPGLAQDIVDDFSAYTASHPSLHLSAGLAFIGGKYPVYQAAEDADGALEQAKDVSGKDAFSYLGTPWKWDVFSEVTNKYRRLRKLVAGREVDLEGLEGPQAILQVLRQLASDEADTAKRLKGRPVWGPWMWRGAYLLTRMAQRYEKQKPALAREIESIRDELNKENYTSISQWGTAARWTQLEIRKVSSEKERQ